MNSLVQQYWFEQKRDLLFVTTVSVCVAVADRFLDSGVRGWGYLYLYCCIIGISLGLAVMSEEIQKESIYFLEYLPLSRKRIWTSKYLLGLGLAWLYVLPPLISRALGPRPSPHINWSADLISRLGYFLGTVSPVWVVFAGLALVFFWYTLLYAVSITSRWSSGAVFVIGMVVFMITNIFFFEFPDQTGLMPNGRELAPVLLLTGALMAGFSYVVFVSFSHRTWSKARAFSLLAALFFVIVIPAGLQILRLCGHWSRPLIFEAHVEQCVMPDVRDSRLLAVTFTDRRSGKHTVVIRLDDGQVVHVLPRQSHGLPDFHTGESYWVPGTDELSYLSGEGAFGVFPGPMRIVRSSAQGRGASAIPLPPAPEPSATPLFFDRPPDSKYRQESVLRLQASKISWFPGGTALLLSNYSTSPLPEAAAAGAKFINYRVLAPNGSLLTEFALPLQHIKLRSANTRLYWLTPEPRQQQPAVSDDLSPDALTAPAQDSAPATSTFEFFDAATEQQWTVTLPADIRFSADLTRAVAWKVRKNGRDTFKTLYRYDLHSGEATVLLNGLEFADYDDRVRASLTSAVFDADLRRLAVLRHRMDDEQLLPSILLYDLDSGAERILVNEGVLPAVKLASIYTDRYDWRTSDLKFMPGRQALYYSIFDRKLKSVGYYRIDLSPAAAAAHDPASPGAALTAGARDAYFSLSPLTLSPDGIRHLKHLQPTPPNQLHGRIDWALEILGYGSDAPVRLCKQTAGTPDLRMTLSAQAAENQIPKAVQWYNNDTVLYILGGKLWAVNADGSGLRQVFPPTRGD